jgi:hypothetical protein
VRTGASLYAGAVQRFLAAALLLICACSAPVAAPSPTSASAFASPSSSVPFSAPPSARSSSTPLPSPTPFTTPPPITDLSQVFRPASNGWRPSGLTIIAPSSDDLGNTGLVGIAIGPGGSASAPISILSFTSGGWDIRPDGGALAVVVATDRGTRIATWNFGASLGAWVTSPDPAAPLSMPIWSKDGAWLYYGMPGTAAATNYTGTVRRVRPDGSGDALIATLERFGGLQELTPDGGGLIWSRIQEGGSAEILDLATGVNRHLADVAGVASIRARQPRILLTVGGCCAGYPGGSLELWNDVTLTSRTIVDRTNVPRVAWGTGAWDPTGTRLVVGRFDEASPYRASLVTMDPETGAAQPIPGTIGAGRVLWLDEGIVFLVYPESGKEVQLMMLPASGGGPTSLYKGTNMYRMVIIRP